MKKPKWIDCFGGCGSQVNELSSPYTGYCRGCKEKQKAAQPKQEGWEKAYDRVPFDFWNPGRLKDFLRTEIEKAEKEAYEKGYVDGEKELRDSWSRNIADELLN